MSTLSHPDRKLMVSIKFVPGDLWIGAFVRKTALPTQNTTFWQVYVCILPMLPIYFSWWTRGGQGE